MIYLIRSAAVVDESIPSFEFILKIGYCRDDREKTRTAIYITENPTIKTLFTIPGGTEQDEKNLHHHFRKYLKYGNEWFSYNQEILDFFTTHTTKESLEELDLHLSKNKQDKLQKERNAKFLENKQKYINPILNSLGEVDILEYVKKQEELVEILNTLFLTSSDIDSYFKTNYPDINFDISETISKKVQKILQEFEDQKFFTGKMKYLYSLHMDTDLAKQVLNNIYDTHYAKYYWTIPAGRAGTLHYQKGELEKEYQAILNPDPVVEESEEEIKIKEILKQKLISSFTIDTKYLKSDIKESLRKIYTELGYDKTPKANDLEEYFEIKDCLISNTVTRKMEHGFKIIKLKD